MEKGERAEAVGYMIENIQIYLLIDGTQIVPTVKYNKHLDIGKRYNLALIGIKV
jgi:hypothetical protein